MAIIESLKNFFGRLLGAEIGKHVSIHRLCRFYLPGKVKIGNNVVILRNSLLDDRQGLSIGNNVNISARLYPSEDGQTV
jgi:acetyltransferase-like isoleucine patch superfamily enzyme